MAGKSKRKYRTVGCGMTKTEAKRKQKELHDKGHTGRLKKGEYGKWCVETAGKRKTTKRKKK